MNIRNNTILITGGTSGLGLALAKAFYNEGNTVIICGRRQDRLQAICQDHSGMLHYACNVLLQEDRVALINWLQQNHPHCNVFINNAGIQLKFNLQQEINTLMVQEEIGTNVIAPIHLATAFAQHFGQNANATIINVTSGLSFVPLAMVPVYCATKAAMHSFTMSLRYQLKASGIRVVELIPPQVDTELGYQDRPEPNTTHGGLSIADFITEAMAGLAQGDDEVMVAQAKFLRAQGEAMFPKMNP